VAAQVTISVIPLGVRQIRKFVQKLRIDLKIEVPTMNPYAVFSLIIGVLAILMTVIIQVNSSVDKKIEEKLQDANFIRKVAVEVRLPFLIFDEDRRYLADTGASEWIQTIKITKDGRSIKEIIITPKRFLPVPPVIESYDTDIEFEEPQQGEEFTWIYKTILPEMTWARTYPSGMPPRKRFKLQVIELPK